jgi:hypothetical protein
MFSRLDTFQNFNLPLLSPVTIIWKIRKIHTTRTYIAVGIIKLTAVAETIPLTELFGWAGQPNSPL